MSAAPIEEVEDRLADLTEALREGGSPEIAARLEHHARDFTVATRVRRAVNAIRDQLERWREDPAGLPDSPKVTLAANRLEDACRDALAQGVIQAATPTLAAQSRRKLSIVLITLLCAAVALLIPIALVRSGFDFNDIAAVRTLGPERLPRGEESSVELQVLVESSLPEAVRGLEIEPRGGCAEALPGGATCAETAPRLWAEGRLKTYELKLRNQAYGLMFSLSSPKVEAGRIGQARLLLAATDDTPEGRYQIPFSAAYLGYTPQRCELVQRVMGDCPKPRTGAGERHDGLPVPVVLVDVVPGDPSRRLGEKRRIQAEAEEARRAAEERAQQISGAMREIEAVLTETEKLVARKRYEPARERVQKLGTLFAPIESLGLSQSESDALPAKVSQVRARFDTLRDKLHAFENRVFEATFAAMTAESNKRVPEDRLLARIATDYAVSPGYVRDIYTDRADEIQRRMDARQKARADKLKAEQAALEQRCGALPAEAWQSVSRYVRAIYAEPRVEIVLGECMTPRLTERDCWEMRCDFERKEEVAVERPKVVTQHAATFYLSGGRVVRHREES